MKRAVVLAAVVVLAAAACTSPPPDGGGPTTSTTTTSTTTTLPPGGSGVAEALTVGRFHNCVLIDDGTIRCWGSNIAGQLGAGSPGSTTAVPQVVTGITTAVQVAAGDEHTCAALADGTVSCWGGNGRSQLGNGTIGGGSSTPQTVPGLTDVVDIDAGFAHTCAVHTSGALSCWGDNTEGQTGSGIVGGVTTSPVVVLGEGASGPVPLTGVVEVSAGSVHSCARFANGRMACWGDNGGGRLGLGNGFGESPVAVATPGLEAVTAVAAGNTNTCAAVAGGELYCWGLNNFGQLGVGTGGGSQSPRLVESISGVETLALAGDHACAILAGGSLRCWGRNEDAQVGTGVPSPEIRLPTAPAVSEGVTAVGTSPQNGHRTCVLLDDGSVTCWGWDVFDALGRPSMQTLEATAVAGLGHTVDVSTGEAHACAAMADGTVQCWGQNSSGQLGDGSVVTRYRPAPVAGIDNAIAVSAASRRSCALLVDGYVSCWGNAEHAQIGVTWSSYVPRIVSGVTGAVSVATGRFHSCAVLADGSERCWGRNNRGELGGGFFSARSATPVTVSGLTGVTSAATGEQFSCSAADDGTARCWGANDLGQLGDSTFGPNEWAVPIPVGLLTSVQMLDSGDDHTCAVNADGTVACWGGNDFLQAGGSASPVRTPSPVSGVSNAVEVGAGASHSCAVLADGGVSCWGSNGARELGSWVPGPTGSAVAVPGLPAVHTVSAGSAFSCAIAVDATTWCWGSNASGRLATNPGWDPVVLTL